MTLPLHLRRRLIDKSSCDHLRVETHRAEPEALVIAVQGEVDVTSAPILRDALDQALESRPPRVVVDLNGVTFMDAALLNLMVLTRHRAWAMGTCMRVRCRTDHGRLLFKTVGLEFLLD